MNLFRMSCIYGLVILFGGCQAPSNIISVYGPRWIDYEEWGKAQIGMDKKDVLNLLGEPYMTSQGELLNGSSSQTYIYKLRTKLYVTKQATKQQAYIWDKDSPPAYISADKKPEKFANTLVWGEIFDVFFVFENNKLVKWYSPDLKRISDSIKDTLNVRNAP